MLASAGLVFGIYQNCDQGPEYYQSYEPTDVEQVVAVDEEEKNPKSAHAAARYYNLLRADPSTGTFSAADVKRAYDQAQKNSERAKVPASKIGWKSIGPDNIGGRTRAIVIDNKDNSVIFAGSVSGGLFKSTNKGNTWESISYERSGRYKSLAISCMEQTSEGTIYFGTGERGFTSFGGLDRANTRSGFKGMGIWKSEDRGETWTHLESTIPDQPYGASRSTWSSVCELAIDPTDPQHILAATMNGVMETKDGGESWSKISGLLPNTYLEVEFADDGQTVFVASQGSLYRSSDGAQSFTQVSGSSFPQSDVGRIEIDLAPTDNSVVYASIATSSSEVVKGIYKSVDKGQTWNVIAEGGRNSLFDPFRNSIRGQGQYDNAIAVSPADKHQIFLAGVHFWTYKGDGNFNGQWKKVANSTPFFGSDDQFKDPQYLHVDHHEIRFDTESDPPVMYIGNDGGVFKTSSDFRQKTTPDYKEINTGYTTTQFYAFDVAKNGDVLGGTQDNGTFKYLKDGLTGRSYREVLGGDGFYSEISKLRPNVYISESVQADISRSSDRGGSYNGDLFDDNISGGTLFNTPFQMFEKRNDPLSKDSIIYSARSEVVVKANESVTADGNEVDLYKADTNLEQTNGNVFRAQVDLARLPGDSIEITSSNGVDFKIRIDSSLQPEEDIKVKDPVRALFAVGLRNNIWITPGMLNFNKNPTWFKVADINLNTPSSLRFSDDGKSLLVGGGNGRGSGKVFRIDGIRQADYSYENVDDPDNFVDSNDIKVQRIGDFNGIVTSATFDQNNKNKMVVTTGNYGVDNHVYYTDSAMSDDPNYTELDGSGQNSLPEMPVYDGMFKLDSTTQIVIGAEMGTWTYDLATPTQGWQEINNGMPRVPVYMLRQLRKGDEYKAYAATFGRGIFSTTQKWSNTEDAISSKEDSYEPSIKAYPNPASNYTNLEVDLEKGSQGQLEMINMQGKVLKQKQLVGTQGDQAIRMSTANLKKGTYVVRIRGEGISKSTKVVVQ